MWKVKALLQFVLAHIPYGITINHQLQNLKYIGRASLKTERMLYSFCYQAQQISDFNLRRKIEGASVLEIGSGWNAIGCIIFHLKGASKIYAFDHLPHSDLKIIKCLLNVIYSNPDRCACSLGIRSDLLFIKIKKLLCAGTLEELLEWLSVEYHAPGDAGSTDLGNKSIDIIFSYGVRVIVKCCV